MYPYVEAYTYPSDLEDSFIDSFNINRICDSDRSVESVANLLQMQTSKKLINIFKMYTLHLVHILWNKFRVEAREKLSKII